MKLTINFLDNGFEKVGSQIVRKSNFSGDSIVREDLKSGESPDLACGSNIASGGDTAYRSMVNKSISDLRVKVSNLEEAMKRCQGNVKPLRRYAPCWLHVIPVCSIRVGKEELSTLLCTYQCYAPLPPIRA